MEIKGTFVKREIAGEHFLVPVGAAAKQHNGLFAMNELGSFIWDCLAEAEDDAAVVARILEEYEIDRETAAADAAEFLGKLREMGVL